MSNESGAYPQRRARPAPARRRLTGNPGGILLAAMLVVTSAAAETAGERIASKGASRPGAVACASCHGPDGGGNEQAGFPRLAGLDAAYIESQLRAYQQSRRKNPVMAGMAAPLTDQDIKDVAAYYAALAPVSHAQAPEGVATPVGEQLASYGDMANRGLPGCFQCHGPGGLGVGAYFPPLAGQPYSYLLAQIQAWKSGARSGEPLGLMKAVADQLTDAEARSVAAYLAALPLKTDNPPDKQQGAVQPATGSADEPAAGKGKRAVLTAHHGEVEPGREPGAEGYFRSGEVFSMERRQYITVGLTAASMRPTSLHKTSPDRNCSVTHLCKSQ